MGIHGNSGDIMVRAVNNRVRVMGSHPTTYHWQPAFPRKMPSQSLWISMLETLCRRAGMNGTECASSFHGRSPAAWSRISQRSGTRPMAPSRSPSSACFGRGWVGGSASRRHTEFGERIFRLARSIIIAGCHYLRSGVSGILRPEADDRRRQQHDDEDTGEPRDSYSNALTHKLPHIGWTCRIWRPTASTRTLQNIGLTG